MCVFSIVSNNLDKYNSVSPLKNENIVRNCVHFRGCLPERVPKKMAAGPIAERNQGETSFRRIPKKFRKFLLRDSPMEQRLAVGH